MSLRPRSLWFVSATLLLLVALPSPAPSSIFDNSCLNANSLSATLLYPYFEVDFSDPGARTTLIAIGNVWGGPTLARVTLWTEWGLPTFSFSLYLESGDIQTINLRDIFATGDVPITGPGASGYPGCDDIIGGSIGMTPLLIQLAHTGQKVLGTCWSSGLQGSNVATGYVTVDDSVRCPAANGGGSSNPTYSSYFSGAEPVAGFANNLWGDWYLVTPNENYAAGFQAVGLQAGSTAFFEDGDYTFYGVHVGFSGADRRRPLPSLYYSRYLIGGPFSGGTKMLVWRDTRSTAGPVSCGSAANTCASAACQPAWLPLGEDSIQAWDEAGNRVEWDNTSYLDLATQKFDVDDLPHPYNFGWLRLDLDTSAGVPSQAWVGFESNAEGRYSVGLEATPHEFGDNCLRDPTP